MNNRELTKKIIAGMLIENTGVHMLDSGMAYGRHWQRNQGRHFEQEHPVSLRISQYGIEYSRNLYHFLTRCLSYDKGMNNSLMSFARKPQFEYTGWLEIIAAWMEHKKYVEVLSDNSYNRENNLSQDIQYSLISLDSTRRSDIYDASHIILQAHGGCDARGGYTIPKVFELSDVDTFLMQADGHIYCESGENGHNWFTDDSYNWYQDGSTRGINLRDLDILDFDTLQDEYPVEWEHAVNNQIIIPDSQLPMFQDYKPTIINPALKAFIAMVKPSKSDYQD